MVPKELPKDLAETRWWVLVDPDIEGSHLWIREIPNTRDMLVVTVSFEDHSRVCVLRMPQDMAPTLATEVDGTLIYQSMGGQPVEDSLNDALEYACSYL